ncbi:MAG: YedE family putative selenium transporter [Lachnospirales bacterium]
MKIKKENLPIYIGFIVFAILALFLMLQGNPKNMGICTACFIRDTAGALGLHSAAAVQYFRPEVFGFIIGAFILSMIKKDFKSTGTSNYATNFILGFIMMIGSLIFLGCPLRMTLRLGAGDLNALVGFFGFVGGVGVGSLFVKKGYSLSKQVESAPSEKYATISIVIILTLVALLIPAAFLASTEGPGSMHAPFIVSLVVAIIIGAMAYQTKICFSGTFKNVFLFKDYTYLIGYALFLIVLVIGNMAIGNFHLSFADQPVAHTDSFYNFGGLFLVGFSSVLALGCPLRQCIKAGTGNTDAFMVILGLFMGAAFAHNFSTASSGTGVGANGPIAFWISLVVLFIIAFLNLKKKEN